MAKLYFSYAAMNAGKSTMLLQAAYNYRERGMRALLLNERLPPVGYLGAAVIFVTIVGVELVPALRGVRHEPTLRESA